MNKGIAGIALLAISLILVISGCVNQNADLNDIANQKDKKAIGPYSCDSDSDCAVKDVHNCCGYYPRCVNKGYIPDIEAVQRECKEKGIVSICGFAEITGCKCINSKCESIQRDIVV